jgi:hypothetical protein
VNDYFRPMGNATFSKPTTFTLAVSLNTPTTPTCTFCT